MMISGVEFATYIVGVNRYAQISVDGRCYVAQTPYYNKGATYIAQVEGHGWIMGPSGKRTKRFRSREAAMEAAVKLSRGTPKCP